MKNKPVKKFKDYYDTDCAQLLADKVKQVMPSFNEKDFVSKIAAELDGKEFLQRQDLFADAFEQFMPGSYAETISIFKKILGPELETTVVMFTYGWWLWPVGRFVQKSVGNNLNDLMKEDPSKAKKIISEWQKNGPSKATLWIIKHGLRSERK